MYKNLAVKVTRACNLANIQSYDCLFVNLHDHSEDESSNIYEFFRVYYTVFQVN